MFNFNYIFLEVLFGFQCSYDTYLLFFTSMYKFAFCFYWTCKNRAVLYSLEVFANECLMFILALAHSSLFPFVISLGVGIDVLKNCLRPRVKLLFFKVGLCCFCQTSADTTILGSCQATFTGRDQWIWSPSSLWGRISPRLPSLCIPQLLISAPLPFGFIKIGN